MVRVYVFDRTGKLVGPVESPKLVLSDAEWKQRLKPEQFEVLRSKGTERAFCGTLLDNKQEGVYTCAGCGLPLFSSDSKFHSGTGWPSFFQPIGKGNVAEQTDHSHGMVRSEINCARCDGHLGHVFDDGPRPTGLRFCLNSASLNFTPSDKLATLADPIAEKLQEKSAAAEHGVR
jgi:methionine-R-sulfoxide reductase